MSKNQLNMYEADDWLSIYSLLEQEFLPIEFFEVEYKSGKSGFPKDLWKTYSAFANTNLGFILIGISENKNDIIIDGLTDKQINEYQKQFWNDVNNPNTVSRNILTNNDVKVIEIKNKKLLAFRIPFALRTERPIYLTRNPFSNTYKRNHEGDYRCTDEEIKRMLADSNVELKKDSSILENYTIDDFDPNSIKHFRQLFLSSKPNHPWHSLGDLDLFKKIGAYRIDRNTKKQGITLAGLLMFGRADSLQGQEQLPNYFPEFREKLSLDTNIRWTDRIYPDGTWECNLLQFYFKIWNKLSSTLPKPFLLNNDERIDETPTHIALREAFVNALVHTDYSLSGNIIIELDTEKFIFSNPGNLLISLHQYYEGGISECRNPALQQMFMLIGRAEKAGSGVDKIMSGWQTSHWRKPFLEIEHQPDRVKLTLPMFNVIPDSVLNELNETFDNVHHLSPDELTALSFCLIEGAISNQRLQYVLSLHSTDITALLKRLCDNDYLESDKNGRWTIYKIKQKVDTSKQRKVDTSKQRKVDTSKQRKVDTSKQRKVDTSKQRKVDTSKQRKVDTSKQRKVDTSKKNINTRMKRVDLEIEIMKICKNQYFKMEEVAIKLNKSVDYLKNKVFPDMIKKEMLQKHFPYTDNHPEQGYKTSEDYAENL